MNQRIDREKARAAKLKLKVQLHVSLNTEDQVRKQNVDPCGNNTLLGVINLRSSYLFSLLSVICHTLSCLQDNSLDALDEKVAEVHHSCVDDRVSSLTTLEKLGSIENYMLLLLQSIESIPEENLEMMQKIKDSEKRARYVSVTICAQTKSER